MNCYETAQLNPDIIQSGAWSSFDYYSQDDNVIDFDCSFIMKDTDHADRIEKSLSSVSPVTSKKLKNINDLEETIDKAILRYRKYNGRDPVVDRKYISYLYCFTKINYQNMKIAFFDNDRIKIYFDSNASNIIIDYYYLMKGKCIISFVKKGVMKVIESTLFDVENILGENVL